MENNQHIPDHWLTIAKKIHSIAQTGLTFTKDSFDRERYQELLDLSITILNHITEIDTRKLDFIFNREIGYQTPKVGVRAVIFKEHKILLVREKMDNKWCLPGGYADVGLTPGEIVVKEVKEESGLDVRPTRLLGLIDYNKHQQRPFPFDLYQIFMACEVIGGVPQHGNETSEVAFFDMDQLPELSTRRVTKEQICKMYELYHHPSLDPVFD